MSGGLLANAKLFELSPEHVDEGNRIGFLHEDKAAALGRLMAVDGQRDPIKVVANPKNPAQPWRLVTGMHRLIGARIECIPVWAIEVTGKSEDLADLEASENLHRRPLAPIERAKFVAALVHAARDRLARDKGELSQQKLAAKARWERVKLGETRAEAALTDEVNDARSNLGRAYGWQELAIDALDMSRSAIHRALELHRLIIEPFPELAEALSSHPVVGENASQLRAIAAVQSEADRRKVITALLADHEIGADDARILAGVGTIPAGVTPVAYQKHWNAIEGGWSRLGTSEKRAFLPRFVALMTPDMKRTLRDQLNAELGGETGK